LTGIGLRIKVKIVLVYSRGVDKFFKTLAKLASSPALSLAKTENNWPKYRKGQ
jgi:hypothetical protein